MKLSILIVSYRKDIDFAEYAMQSCKKFATGFHEMIIVVPHDDVESFERAAFGTEFTVKGFYEREGKGMLHHQAIICEADRWCPGADAILHMDSDCIFWEPCTPDDFLVDGKPILYRERFENFEKSYPTRYGWKDAVLSATGIDPVYETMVRHPSIHILATYEATRSLIGSKHRINWKEYILSCENSFPQTFAEFPTLGAVALQYGTDLYHWVDWNCEGGNYTYEHGRDKLISFWSHGGLDKDNDRHPGRTPREMIEEILK